MNGRLLSLEATTTEPRRAARLLCRPADTLAEHAWHDAIRHEVFVAEQGVFPHTDRDEHDRAASTVHVLGYVDGVPAGTVRLFPLDPAAGLWQGDRLAVLKGFRMHGLGAPLVRFAVATAGVHAGGREGARMLAHVQLSNVTFFERLGWTRAGEPELYVGLPHQQMTIALPSPGADPRAGGRRG